MLKSFSGRIRLAFLTILVLELGMVGFTLSKTLRQETDELALANHALALSEIAARHASVIALAPTGSEAATQAAGQLRRVTDQLDQAMNVLATGGAAPLHLDATELHAIARPKTPEIERQVMAAKGLWAQARPLFDRAAQSVQVDVDSLADLERRLEEALDRLSNLVEVHLVGQERSIVYFELIAAAATLLVIVFSMIWLRKSVVHPLQQLVRSTEQMSLGELSERVPQGGPAEVASLAAAVERLRVSIAKLIRTAE